MSISTVSITMKASIIEKPGQTHSIWETEIKEILIHDLINTDQEEWNQGQCQ